MNELWILNKIQKTRFWKPSYKNQQMWDKINSRICLMLSVYEGFRQMVKYGWHGPVKTSYITRFNWAWKWEEEQLNLNFNEGQ